ARACATHACMAATCFGSILSFLESMAGLAPVSRHLMPVRTRAKTTAAEILGPLKPRQSAVGLKIFFAKSFRDLAPSAQDFASGFLNFRGLLTISRRTRDP